MPSFGSHLTQFFKTSVRSVKNAWETLDQWSTLFPEATKPSFEFFYKSMALAMTISVIDHAIYLVADPSTDTASHAGGLLACLFLARQFMKPIWAEEALRNPPPPAEIVEPLPSDPRNPALA